MPRRAHGGGGAYRAFVRKKCKGKAKPSPQVLAALKHEYAALSADEKDNVALAGEAMTVSRALGALPPAASPTKACSLEAGQEAAKQRNPDSVSLFPREARKFCTDKSRTKS